MTPTPDLGRAVAAIRVLFRAAATSFAVVDETGEHLRFVAADGAGAERIVGVELPVGRGIAGFVAMSGQAMVVGDVQQDARFARDVAEETQYVPTSMAVVPVLAADGEVCGVLSVLDPATDASTGWSLSVLGTLGDLVGLLLAAREDAGEEPAGAGGARSDLQELVTRVAAAGPTGERLATDVLAAVTAYLDESHR